MAGPLDRGANPDRRLQIDQRECLHAGTVHDVGEEAGKRPGSLGGDPAHLGPRRLGQGAAGADEEAEEIAGGLRVAERSVGSIVGDPEAAAEERQAVALECGEQDPGEVQGVVDPSGRERVGEQRAQKEQIERPAVCDERGITAEAGESRSRLGGWRRAAHVGVGEPHQALNRKRNRHLRIHDDLEVIDPAKGRVVADRPDLEDPVAPW